jgi:hypothetical protein
MDWHQLKDLIEQASGLDMDSLHVYAGVLGQMAVALLLRRPLRSPIPWLLVLAAVAANEVYDYRYEVWPNRDDQLAGGIRDAWNTMLLPTLILLGARFHPRLFTGAPARPGESSSDPG